MKTLTNISLMIGSLVLFLSNITAPDILVKKSIYEVYYSQKLEQPIWLVYKSTNRPTNVNRGSMDFWLEPQIKTSDGKDYEKNVWDKGHIAPAATFSDNMENLKTTFSYLNCALQNQYLNRGEWRLLEEQERKWDDKEFLTVKVSLDFDKSSIVLPTGATIPKAFTKHIYFETSKNWKCYYFLNEKPTKPWEEHQIKCSH
jgi:endonuclease G, mitochondrial